MIQAEWVVFERRARWSTALRTMLQRNTPASSRSRIYEVRTLDQFDSRLEQRPGSIGLIEVCGPDFGELLTWLADRKLSGQPNLIVALLDLGFNSSSQADIPTRSGIQLAIDALREAGVVEVIESPRQLQILFALEERCSDRCAGFSAVSGENGSMAEWAWSALPWQDS